MRTFFLLLLFPLCAHAQNITTYCGKGTEAYSGDNGICILAELNDPVFMCFDASNNIFFSDAVNHVIRKINTSGIISTVAGKGTQGYSGDGGFATNAQLAFPHGIQIDATGNLFIADYANSVIRKVGPTGKISTIAGTNVPGYSGDAGQAMLAKINGPYGLAIDNAGSIYFSEVGNHIIRRVNAMGVINTIAGNGTSGFSGDNGNATIAQLKTPGGICRDNAGNIYISDYQNNRVRKVSISGIMTTFAGNGTSGNTGDNSLANAAQLNAPNGVDIDASGNIYISDNFAYVVRKVDASGIITTVVGNGTMGSGGDGGPATAAQLNRPNCVAFNAAGNMFIVDSYNNKIRKVTYHPEGIENINPFTQNINIYPSPARDKLIIEETSPQPSPREREVLLYNTVGQLMCRLQMNKDKTTINISAYAPGLYFVHVGGVYAGRFVKE